MSENMYIAWSTDEKIFARAENGGAVTSILTYALKTGVVDGVVTLKAVNGNRFSGVPVLVTDPKELIDTAGSLHCSSSNIPRFVKEYLRGSATMKLAVVGKPCDIRAIIELQKREQVSIDNITLIGLNCTGTIAPAIAKELFIQEFKVNPDDVVKEDFDDNKLIITLKDGTTKSKSLKKLEENGYGRRENCRRCEFNIPTYADLACGKWGAEDQKGSFVQACSDKGKALVEGAKKKDFIKVITPDKANIQLRKSKDEAAIKLAQKWSEITLAPLRTLDLLERQEYWMSEFSKCIKCYGCRDACPVCYCSNCILDADRGYVESGMVPPNALFPITRLAHVGDSCIGCGQCEDACPMEIPLARLFAVLHSELSEVFDYTPGIDIEERPPLASAMDAEMLIDDIFLDIASMKEREK